MSSITPLLFALLVPQSGLTGDYPTRDTLEGHLTPTAAVREPLTWIRREVVLMGTTLVMDVAASERATAIAATTDVMGLVRDWEHRLSLWIPESELSRLRSSPPGEPFRLTPETAAALERVLPWIEETGRAFDPAIASLVDLWASTSSDEWPLPDLITHARRQGGIDRLSFDPLAQTITRHSVSVGIDPGGFGKGLALDHASRLLADLAIDNALLNFGGQVLAIGSPADRPTWPVEVADPRERSRAVLTLELRDVSASTTSVSERFRVVDDGHIGHVIDPRSGEPVPAWGSVTVVARDALLADILSTALFVLGPEAARRWAEDRPEFGVLVVEAADDGLRINHNDAFIQWIVPKKASIP